MDQQLSPWRSRLNICTIARTAGDFETHISRLIKGTQADCKQGGIMEFVMFEDVDGMEVFVNPERVIWVREYPNATTVISCGHEDRFAVRLAPAQAVAMLGK